MSDKIKAYITTFIIIGFFAGILYASLVILIGENTDNKVEELEQELYEANSEVNKQYHKIHNLKSEVETLEYEKEELESEKGSMEIDEIDSFTMAVCSSNDLESEFMTIENMDSNIVNIDYIHDRNSVLLTANMDIEYTDLDYTDMTNFFEEGNQPESWMCNR